MTDNELEILDYKLTYEGRLVFEDLIRRVVLENKNNKDYKFNIYQALCNTIWYNEKELVRYSCSWRYAGELIANFENKHDIKKINFIEIDYNYLEYYCSGKESIVENWILERFNKEGWKLAEYE